MDQNIVFTMIHQIYFFPSCLVINLFILLLLSLFQLYLEEDDFFLTVGS